jgi:hypothetical protein
MKIFLYIRRVETPFGSGIKKWQLPIDTFPLRVHQTIFPPNSFVAPHVHPENEPDAPGGSLRIVGSFNRYREYVGEHAEQRNVKNLLAITTIFVTLLNWRIQNV